MVGDSGMVDSINPEAIINSAVTTLVSRKHGNLTDRLWGKLLSHFPVMRADLAGIDCDTLCTDGKRIYYDPKFVRDICLDAIEENQINKLADVIKFLLSHELMHVIYRNITPDEKDTTFAIPGPMDKAWEVLHNMANMAQDAIINARLKKEFGIFPSGCNKRDEEGNVVKKYKFCLYEGDVEKSWTQAFIETCASANRELAKELGEKVTIPDGYYENIALFRELFNRCRKEHKQGKGDNMPENSGFSGSGFQGQSGKENEPEEQNSGGSFDSQDQSEKEEQNEQNSASSSGSQGQSNKEDKLKGQNSAGSSGSQKERQDQPADGIEDKIRKAIEKVLSGNATMDNHDQNVIEDVKKKIDRVMNEIRHEAARYRVGSDPRQASILITLAERYFRTKPEPWYVGISLLLKNKTNEGPQIRERVQPVEMLTQVMTGNSVVGFDKKSRQLDIAFAVDTSGSMSDEAMIAGVLKILGYLERNIPKGSHGHRFIFAQVDAGIEEWQEMRIPSKEYQEFKKAISSEGFRRAGCGGTRFEPFFQKIAEMKKKPDAVVVFSDMQLFDYPEVERACQKFRNNIVWLCSEESIPDEFYKYKIGRAYDASSMIDEIAISR